jgi:SAM-dependent methyltransferase
MRERLEAALPGAVALEGTAESMPLPDGSADVVVAAQAFHWFDQPVALREIARVLRPRGRVGLIWNMRDESVEWVARLSAIIGAEPLDRGDTTLAVDASGLFGPVERREWRWEQPVTRARLQELVLSRSYCASLPETERAPVLEAVGRLHDEAAGHDGLAMPYVTYGFRAARR